MESRPDAAPGPDVAAALRTASEVGPYFAVDVVDGPAGVSDGDAARWRPFVDLLVDPLALGERIDFGRQLLAGLTELPAHAVEERVVASVVFQGLAARLLSPVVAAWVLAGVVPDLAPERLYLGPPAAGPLSLRIRAPEGCRPVDADGTGRAVERIRELVLERQIRPLVAAVRQHSRLSPRLLWGNVASALVGTVVALAASGEVGPKGRSGGELAKRLLDLAPLAGAGTLVGSSFTRRTCCLYYRIPGGGTCGDCVLNDRPSTRS